MPEYTQKLNRFTAAILAEGRAERQDTLTRLEDRREEALRQAEDQILLEAYRYIHSQVSAIQAEGGRAVSLRLLENKRALALRREAIAQEIFDLVQARIRAYTATPAYPRQLEELLRQCAAALGGAGDLRVYLRGEDLPLSGRLSKLLNGRNASFHRGSFTLGGLAAEAPARALRADATFDSAMGALDGHFAELFGLSLAAETGGPEDG